MNTVPTDLPTTPAEPSKWALLRPYLLDVVGPFVAYAVVHAFGAAGIWAMTAAGAVAGLGTMVNTVRRRRLDALGMLVILEILASIAVIAYVRDPRLLLVRPSVYTGIAAVYIASSAFARRPLSYVGARAIVARKGPARLAAFEQVWADSREFRRTHRLVTMALGLCLAVDSILRVVIVYHSSFERAAWLSNVPHVSALALMMILSAVAGRRFRRLVEERMARPGGTAGK